MQRKRGGGWKLVADVWRISFQLEFDIHSVHCYKNSTSCFFELCTILHKLCYQQRSNKHFNGFVVLYQRFLTWTWPTHFTYIFAVSFQRRQNGAVEFFSVPLRNAISWQTTQIFLFNRLCCVPSFKRASKALLQVSQVEGQNSPDLK